LAKLAKQNEKPTVATGASVVMKHMLIHRKSGGPWGRA